ncbi:MAG TPA: exopolysaccharide Pel transporter PelG [Candidatus Choladousia intestinigallinarum]|nr:exopolysaccharide Pel transporter PelG [Candidatus Choladousia intestinigallinarum]
MAGVGFELKKIFRDNSSLLNSLKGYSVTAVVTEGPMVLTVLLLFVLRFLMREAHASYREQEIFLFIITYVMIFSLIFSNTLLMFSDRFVSDCIYKDETEKILPSFFGLAFFLLLIGGTAAFIYLLTLPVSFLFRAAALLQFCSMLVLWLQIAFLSAVKQYSRILLGFAAGFLVAVLLTLLFLGTGTDPLMAAMWGAAAGFFTMMVFFLTQLLRCYPLGKFQLFSFFPALDQYKILIATGFFMALGLFAHNFIIWCSEYANRVFPTGVFCSRYDVPAFFAAFTIIPMLVQFVVSLEVNFCVKNRVYFSTILRGGRLSDIRAAKKDMEKVLFRELAHMMEIQILFTIISVTFLAGLLSYFGLDPDMVSIFRILCFGYLLYGFFKALTILLLYFDDRAGACASAALFAALSILFTALSLQLEISAWGIGFWGAGALTSLFALLRLKWYVKTLEYHVFCRQPLFTDTDTHFWEKLEIRLRQSDQNLKPGKEKKRPYERKKNS